MTIERSLVSSGIRDFRNGIRGIVESVETGDPVLIVRHDQPAAVLISRAEAERWAAFERSLSALHAQGVFPELARDTSELRAYVDGTAPVDAATIERLAQTPREIAAPLRTVHITALREHITEHLDEVQAGRSLTIISGQRLVATMISPREFDRLRSLARVAAWFRSAGVNLEIASEADLAAWVSGQRLPSAKTRKAAG